MVKRNPFTWLCVVETPVEACSSSAWLGNFSSMLSDCIEVPLWQWISSTASDDSNPLITDYMAWVSKEGRPGQETLDWWLAEWMASHAVAHPSGLLMTLGAVEDSLPERDATWLLYGLARLARHELGVMWSNPPLPLLSRWCDEQTDEQMRVVWAVDTSLLDKAHQAYAEQLQRHCNTVIQVLLVDGDDDVVSKQPISPWLSQLGRREGERFRLCGRVKKAAVKDGTALSTMADALRRMNVPVGWQPQ